MRRTRHLTLLLLLLATLPLQSQILYEISGHGLKKQKSYLLAQYKLIPVSYLDSVPRLMQCYSRCSRLVLETSLNKIDAGEHFARAAMLPDTASYERLLTPEQYTLVDRYLQLHLNLSLKDVGRLRPVVIEGMILDELYKRRLGYDEFRSSENFFQLLATQNDQPICGLDNLEEAIAAAFFREPLIHQAGELVTLANHPERELNQARELIRLYRAGRLADMAYTLRSPDNHTTITYSDYVVYTRRNERWATQLEAWMAQESCFIMLDALYLGSDSGLINILRQRGYKVKEVRGERF